MATEMRTSLASIRVGRWGECASISGLQQYVACSLSSRTPHTLRPFVPALEHSSERAPLWQFHTLVWGFDSFDGLPEETPGLALEGKHWLPGGFSSRGALGLSSAQAAKRAVETYLRAPSRCGHGKDRLVPGFSMSVSREASQPEPSTLHRQLAHLYRVRTCTMHHMSGSQSC
jgi:hypothetical protein